MTIPTFMGLNIGVSALEAMQQAQSVVGNNIANANTAGYVQETPTMVEGPSYPPSNGDGPDIGGQFAQGVQVSDVSRQVSDFYDEQDRANQGTYQMYSTHDSILTQVQSVLNEPSDTSIQNSVDQFFQAWQTLSTDSTDTAARQTVISQAQMMGQTFQTVTTQLEQLQSNLQSVIQGQVSQLNQDASQIAELNQQIVSTKQAGESPNQLLDQRGKLLDDMSQLANVTYNYDASGNGAIDVSIVPTSGSSISLVNGYTASTYPSGNAALANITGGKIAGNMQGVDDTARILANVNQFLTQLASTVNGQHESGQGLDGSTGQAFFDTTTDSAGNVLLSVDPAMTSTKVAAASTSASVDDNSNAIAIANLQQTSVSISYSYSSLVSNSTVTSSSSGTFDQLLGQVISGVGTETSAVQANEKTANALLQQSTQLRQSVSGVSLDEQAAQMIQYQNSYSAAGKFISVFDQMLQTLISEIN